MDHQKRDDQHIRDRAYAIWEREGRPDGRDEEIWREAERELGVDGATAERPDPAGDERKAAR